MSYSIHELTQTESTTLFGNPNYAHDFCLVDENKKPLRREVGSENKIIIPLYHSCSYGQIRSIEAYEYWKKYCEKEHLPLKKYTITSLLYLKHNPLSFCKQCIPKRVQIPLFTRKDGYSQPIRDIQKRVEKFVKAQNKLEKSLNRLSEEMIEKTKEIDVFATKHMTDGKEEICSQSEHMTDGKEEIWEPDNSYEL